jgi:formiminotetrahydrofolate cyclodeaminase
MVANLTVGKKEYKEVEGDMLAMAPKAQAIKDRFVRAVDDDTTAFDGVIDAMRLPKTTDEEIAHRDLMIEEATKEAIEVPFSVLRTCLEALEPIEVVARGGNVNSLSDAGVAAHALKAGANGAFLNVIINLPGMSNKTYIDETLAKAKDVLAEVEKRCDAVTASVQTRLEEGITKRTS